MTIRMGHVAWSVFLVLGLVACKTGGGVGNGNDNCVDPCTPLGATRCAGSWIERCDESTNGCLAWEQYANCADTGQQCDASGLEATCQGECQDACPTSGETRCLGTVIQTCFPASSDCLQWVSGTDCGAADMYCLDSGGQASCSDLCSPGQAAEPSGPIPVSGTSDLPAESITSVTWADSANAVSYAVFLGTTCPPPAFPDASFEEVTSSTLSGLTLSANTTYCWQVMAVDAEGCVSTGPIWTFSTACVDPVPGAPTVTSSSMLLPVTTTSTVYTLTFSENVAGVPGSLTWTPVVGTGTMGPPTQSTPSRYELPMNGLMAGDHYTLTVGTTVIDLCGNSLLAPVVLDIRVDDQTGENCSGAVNVTSATFPFSLPGTYGDDAWAGGSCDTTPNNTVWFTYSPSQTGLFDITATNLTATNAYSRLALFEGAGCSPLGAQLGCATADALTVSSEAWLVAGETYTIAFYTDGDEYTMVDPVLDIAQRALDPGEHCTTAADVTGSTFPYVLNGTFTSSGWAGASCDSTPDNTVWYTYTPSQTDTYEITATNNAFATAYSRLAVFEGAGCQPLGAQIDCNTSLTRQISSQVPLTAGVTYTIAFYTDGPARPMENPSIDIHVWTPGPGEACAAAADITGATFPYTIAGTFDDDAWAGGSCDTTPNNTVWYVYTPAQTGVYQVTTTNNTTSTTTYSRLAIFAGSTCNPLGTQLSCTTTVTRSVTVLVSLTAGVPYTLAFFTGGNTYAMVDPTIDLQLLSPNPGEVCPAAMDVTSAIFPLQLTGTFTGELSAGGTCDTTPNNMVWYTYSPAESGFYQITATNHATTAAYSRLAVFEGTGCSPLGAQVECLTSTSGSLSSAVPLEAGRTYTITHYTGGETYTMVDPELDILKVTSGTGLGCSDPVDVTDSPLPITLSGTFDGGSWAGGSCGLTPVRTLWFSFTPSSSGQYEVTALDGTGCWGQVHRLAVFEGSSCSPLGAEIACVSDNENQLSAPAMLSSGVTYTMAFYNENTSCSLVDPTLNVQKIDAGQRCYSTADVTGATFPVQLTGSFDDDPAGGSTCDYSPTNAVWYRYSPPASGKYEIMVRNHSATTANSVLAVFRSLFCDPLGYQETCLAATGKILYHTAYFEAGEEYLILFHTDTDANVMVDPEISITSSTTQPGEYCQLAVDLTGQAMPVTTTGAFTNDPTLPTSCDSTPNNAAWFTFTPTVSGRHDVDFTDGTATVTRLAIFEGTGCPPTGTEVLCQSSVGTAHIHAEPILQAGQAYTFVFFTAAETNAMTNPTVSIVPWVAAPGETCSSPYPVSLTTGTTTIVGDYTYELDPGPSCNATPYNMLWLRFVPTHTGWHNLYFSNSSYDYMVAAVFEGDSCAPYGSELLCDATSAYTKRTQLFLTAGTPYLILLFNLVPSDRMGSMRYEIYETTLAPGFDCTVPADKTSSNYYLSSGRDCWSFTFDSYDNHADHAFTCDSDTGGDVVASYTTGPSQTVLNYQASLTSYDTGGTLGLEITDAPCATGPSLYCITGLTSRTGQIFVVPNTTYYVWMSDSVAGHHRPGGTLCLW